MESSVPLGITRYRGPSGVASLHREKDIYIHNICLCVSQCMCVHAFLCGDGPHQTHCRDRSHITPRHAFTHTYTGKAHRNAKKTPFRSTTHTHTHSGSNSSTEEHEMRNMVYAMCGDMHIYMHARRSPTKYRCVCCEPREIKYTHTQHTHHTIHMHTYIHTYK